MQLQRESMLAVLDEIEALLRLHYEEVALHRDAIHLAPDWGRYMALEEGGQLHVFTAREHGHLIGYSVFFTQCHIHYIETMVAVNDVLFLHPDHRKGSAGVKLIRFSEAQLKAAGAHKVTWHVKFANDFSPILHRLGYSDEEKIVAKLL